MGSVNKDETNNMDLNGFPFCARGQGCVPWFRGYYFGEKIKDRNYVFFILKQMNNVT